MTKPIIFILISFFTLTVKGQTTPSAVSTVQPFGKVDTSDLKMDHCDFEKDANAMVLFDQGDISFDEYGVITFLRHKRVKIFNENGKDEANINIEFIDGINNIQAETVNLNGKTIEYTPVDPKLIYKEKIDKYRKSLVFTFPAVKPGSIIELQYKWKIYSWILPSWPFQSTIPTAYSEVTITMASENQIRTSYKVNMDFSKNTDEHISEGQKTVRALSNIHSFKEEPFMTAVGDNLQRVEFRPLRFFWGNVVNALVYDEEFGGQLDQKLEGENAILASVSSIKNKDILIDSIFNVVKNRMIWNKHNLWFTNDGVKKAWIKKTGNSTEINLILYNLLEKAGLDAFPMMVSTQDNGTVDPDYASLSQFNKTVVYLLIDSAKSYILDATGKYNLYNQVPFDLLGSYGLAVNPKIRNHVLFTIKSDTTAKQLIFINAEINTDGKVNGTADIVSDGYNKQKSLQLYDDLGEKKYKDLLTDNDNELKITALKLNDVKNDTLPLTQHADFELNLTASDGNYIYLNPNLFTTFGTNPFLNENRYSDIDFNYSNKFMVIGIYKIPLGYKIDVLPENQTITLGTNDISFKRIIGEQNGAVVVRYVINRKRTFYSKEEYSGLYKFYKKMYEMLNEQIVLKKS
jgi:hypothetical protein